MKRALFYGDSANEETNLFNRRASWNEEDTLGEKYLEFLAPHSRSYFSRLRPMFSFEVKTLQGLNSFTHVLFRDGLVFLLRFFIRFPRPEGLKTKVLINKELAFAVPQPWRDHTLLYETVTLAQRSTSSDGLEKASGLVIILNLHENQEQSCLKQIVAKEVEKRQEVYLLPYFNQMRGEDYLSYDRADNLMSLKELFSNKVTVINGHDLAHLDGKSCVFIHANPQLVFQCDSNVEHNFLRSGWKNPLLNQAGDGDFVVPLSPYHGMRLTTFEVDKKHGDLEARLFKDLKFPSGSLFRKEPVVNRELEDYFKVFYYSEDLLELAFQLGRQVFEKRED
jgi:hypothetical protein